MGSFESENGEMDEVLDLCIATNDNENERKATDEPDMHSPEWTDYVLGMLTDQEKYKGAPRADGLLRICRSIYGMAVEFKLIPHHISPTYAAVTCVITLGDSTYHGSAECTSDNTDPPYNKYPLATAETRALGRAAKRLLCINVITAEEFSEVSKLEIPTNDEDRTEGGIQPTQIKFIDRICNKLNIDVVDVVTNVVGDHSKIDDLSHAEALMINKALDEYMRQVSEKEDVALNFKPYNQDWSNDF